MVIYKITNLINDKIYIGQTRRNLSIRWNRHIYDSTKRDNSLARAIKKYGKDNFKIENIIRCDSSEQLNHREKMCIKLFDSQNKTKGYNITPGGELRSFNEETILKISIANKRKWSDSLYKKTMSLKRKESSLNRYKENFSVFKAVILKRGGNAPYQYQKGDLIGSWVNQVDCAKDLNVNHKNISACLNGKNKTCNGYIFERI